MTLSLGDGSPQSGGLAAYVSPCGLDDIAPELPSAGWI